MVSDGRPGRRARAALAGRPGRPGRHAARLRLIDALGAEACLRARPGAVAPRRSETVVATARPDGVRARARGRLADARAGAPGDRHASAGRAGRARTRGGACWRAGPRRCVPDGRELPRRAGRPRRAAVTLAGRAARRAGARAPPPRRGAVWRCCGLGDPDADADAGLKSAAAAGDAPRRGAAGASPRPRWPRSRLPDGLAARPALPRDARSPAHLVERLSRLDYPRDLLDVCLIVEEDDTHHARALARDAAAALDARRSSCPRGTVQTKPRALNYALDFCRGCDRRRLRRRGRARRPTSSRRVVAPLRRAARRGRLPAGRARLLQRARQLARRAASRIEYADWFRIVLPGLARLGLVVPLGGTTLFFRRAALEALGGWDAHNVTEDADLGLRLARARLPDRADRHA